MDGWLTLADAAAQQGRTTRQLRNWIAQGRLPALRPTRHITLVRLEDVKACRRRIEQQRRAGRRHDFRTV